MTFVPVDPGISEGDYTEWAKKWAKDIPEGAYTSDNGRLGMHIDDVADIITFSWVDGANKDRFGRYNISDFSVIFESAVGEHYAPPPWYDTGTLIINPVGFGYAPTNFSFSLQTYVLITIYDQVTWKRHKIEVWRTTGITPLWSRDILIDEAAAVEATGLCISSTGKYIVIVTENDKLILYEGS